MPDVQLTPHFKLSEFRCKCCGKVHQQSAKLLAIALEEIRPNTGPIQIVSGFRCSKQNKSVGGKPDSQHLIGLAVDISVIDDAHRHKLLKHLLLFGFPRIGIGKDVIHADLGATTGPVVWTYYA